MLRGRCDLSNVPCSRAGRRAADRCRWPGRDCHGRRRSQSNHGDTREGDAMIKLKDVYPLYLNNEAKQPNADLEVTDKYTGEVAFRVAQADAATIDAGIEGAVAAAEPMARLPAYHRQAVLQ